MLILDMISEFKFPDWKSVLRAAHRIAPEIARLRQSARDANLPVIYINDSGDNLEFNQTAFLRRCTVAGARGAELARMICPGPDDYFIFKPRHSAFYLTPLTALLEHKSVEELILTGTTSHQCVLFTAMDAYVRNYRIVVPTDCIGAPTAGQTRLALSVLKESLRARTLRSRAIRFN